MKVEKLKEPEKKREYQERVKVAYERVKVREVGELEEEEWKLRIPCGECELCMW